MTEFPRTAVDTTSLAELLSPDERSPRDPRPPTAPVALSDASIDADASQGLSDKSPHCVLLVCSSGGHLLELLALRDLWDRDDRCWVTFPTPDAVALLVGETVIPAHYPTNRDIPNLARNIVLAARVLRSRRPRAIVTTGAGVAVPFCYLARACGVRVIYIESLARVTRPSLTGRLIHPVANVFFVQWPAVQRCYKKARFVGALY